VVDLPFDFAPRADLAGLRVGFLHRDFAADYASKEQDAQSLAVLRELGADLIALDLPDFPAEALEILLWAETAAAFDDLTRSNRDDELTMQIEDAWPNKWRVARLIPAVEYLQANRLRTRLMEQMARLMDTVDLYITPTHGRSLWITNATGQPQIAIPNGFRANGLPSNVSLVGRIYDEAALLAAARAVQNATDFHRQVPPLFAP
jgi:Asp-tRNA(Asn)/Glu-tRNA(Gln) amidotransferase A subunit family amidase